MVCALAGSPAQAASGGLLRLAHLSPDSPAVDLTVTPADGGAPVITLPGVHYGTVSGHRELPPGGYTVTVRRAEADPGGPPVLSASVDLTAGGARTVAVTGPFAGLDLAVVDDDLSPPPPGSARVRVVAAAASAPELDVAVAGGGPLAAGLRFGSAGAPAPVPAGAGTLQITGDEVSLEVPVEFAAGSVYSVLVLDRVGGGLTVRPVLDAAGAAVVPSGGVAAGAGGAAGRSPLPGLMVLAALVVLGALVVPRRRR
ncbi:DUF4397 domain-containing protein [Geodermatophilus sp. CPCC 205761]|uniref:DUF4397 domain-containing protein n=1 Tax=Geodermatophilus sp. CPCC 205761 TaxID=2936597 RepID=UPI003EEF9C32